jgi:bifunctional DNA-binding transcriptional regulator/antitoxin component of YhaV-PrlF toxin-antitoxin module
MTIPVDFDLLTGGLATKSEKIRALSRAGASTSEIAKYLDIRYQHARNVQVDAGLVGSKAPEQREAERVLAADKPSANRNWTSLDRSGQIVVPMELLEQAGLKPGDQLYVDATKDGLELLSRRAALLRAQTIIRKYVPAGVSLADELIADRRAEWVREGAGG